jgi:predicted small lipoprotein YifL
MRNTVSKVLIALIAVAAIAACARNAPVYNVAEMPVAASKPNASLDEVGKAIVRAGATLGWQMKAVKPGQILGTLTLREHMAVVDVNYTPQAYSIQYKDSSNLNYDGQTIHKNYNGWVQNLDKAIRAQLSAL